MTHIGKTQNHKESITFICKKFIEVLIIIDV